ncbi:MAG: hypothetical protein LAO76_27690 [Acidobacteriia bacterium]|nr:hypothetical protein [Terriglobia bacterium]
MLPFVAAMLLVVPAHAGSVSGKIRLANVSTPAANQAAGEKENVVIWLEGAHDSKPPETTIKISQRSLQFSPDFAIAVKGQKIEMPNDDDVVHNVYSFTGLNVTFQEVVHSSKTREADCDEQSTQIWRPEWTFIRMHDLPLSVESS